MRLPFLSGDDGMIARVRALDWSATPLGEPDGWPTELVAAASFVLESKFPAALAWGPELVTIYNDAFRPILGDKPEALGRSFRDVWAEVWDEIAPMADRAMAGEATFLEDLPLLIDRYGYSERAYFTFCYSPVRLADGTVAGMIDTVMETTAAVQARERAGILNNELGHRLKNTMSMMQAIAIQTLKGVSDRVAVEALKDRIFALGQANELLLQTSWEGATITSIIDKMLAVHGSGRFVLSGDNLQLGPKAVLSISLLLHELGTNAAKYGALGTPDGRVGLSWRIEGDDLVLEWAETGGPPARDAGTRGFGARIIELGLVGTRRVATHYLSSGFKAEFRAPLARLTD